ncbi:hypothetical protein B296_00019986 [Ensete ventricosum]|uniref:Uncharacterized protein n=1 Tax=Ensete ventricosum TaxID=4639 RepID=A0A427AXM7_ENSVE|nr:hypothetical protein B296_00019986 [Ensete ventricosum]
MKLTKKWVLHTGQRRQSQTKEGGEAEEEEEVSSPPIKQRLLLKPSCSSPPLGPQSVRMREAVERERERERARSFLASSQALDSRVLESRVRVQP